MNRREALQNCQKGRGELNRWLSAFDNPWDNRRMAVVEEEPEPGAGPAVVIVTVIALIILIVILFYGLAVQHWFGFDQPATVGAAPSVTLVEKPSGYIRSRGEPYRAVGE